MILYCMAIMYIVYTLSENNKTITDVNLNN